jgi:hypothetical protein
VNIGMARMAHFRALDRQQQIDAIRRLAALGNSDHDIAEATQLSVDFVRCLIRDGKVSQMICDSVGP